MTTPARARPGLGFGRWIAVLRDRWLRLSLLTKILLPVNGVGLFAIVAVTGLTYRVARDAVRQEIVISGSRAVDSFAQMNSLEFLDSAQGPLNLRLRLHKLRDGDPERRILGAYAAGPDMSLLARVGETEDFDELAPSRFPLDKPELVVTIGDSIVMAKAVVYDKVTVGYVAFRLDTSPIVKAGARILRSSILIAASFVTLSVAIAIIVLRLLLRPVVRLGAAAQLFAQGHYSHRITVGRQRDEISTAAQSFNAMCDAIEIHMRFSNGALIERIRTGEALEQAREHFLSVAFGDAVNYTDWSQRQSAQDVFDTLTRYYTCIGKLIVRRFGGIVDKFMGDGVMAHFGLLRHPANLFPPAPAAPADVLPEGVDLQHVREALRAILYSQVVLRVLAHMMFEFEEQEPLAYRFGVASGRCLVGALGAKDIMLDYSVIGGVVNLASRLEQKARPGGLVVDRFTYIDSGAGFLDARDAGKHPVKGMPQPIQIYAVRGFQDPDEARDMQSYLLDEFFSEEVILELLLKGEEKHLSLARTLVENEVQKNPFLPV